MSTEIEKMYENAGIGLVANVKFPTNDVNYSISFPPFTLEKQLELIKLLGSIRDYTVEIDKCKVYFVACREAGSNNKHWGSHNIFEEALAEVVNDVWKDLTEEEKEQVRSVLK